MDGAIWGAIIGAGVVLASNGLQFWREVRAERRSDARERAALAAERSHAAATVCDQLVLEILTAFRRDDNEDFMVQRIYEIGSEINIQIVDLPRPVANRVAKDIAYILDADRLGQGSHGLEPCHYHWPGTIINHASTDAHSVLTAFLRGEDVPPPSEWVTEYSFAYRDYLAELDSDYEPAGFDIREARRLWLADHPEAREALENLESS